MTLILGAIADDFTGATDLANTWVKEGLRVCQVIGLPDAQTDIGDADAVVVALKFRTAPVAEACQQSLAALEWLQQAGAQQIVFKYCSTFDSTAKGNIGPVADALLDAMGGEFALICPAFPDNGRTIYKGELFVGDLLLSESSMKDHPLTPMRDANLIRLMQGQSRYHTGLIALQDVRAGTDRIHAKIDVLKAEGYRYGVIDAITDADLRVIGQAAAGHGLVTGGSGVGMGLPGNFRDSGVLGAVSTPELPRATGRALVLAGSCSAATRAQIAAVSGRWPCRKLDVDGLAKGPAEITAAVDWTMGQPPDSPVLIYASSDPAEVAEVQQRYGVARAGQMVEAALSGIAVTLSQSGFTRIVVAGGETSGAVVSALGVRTLRIGPEIAPGVPWTQTVSDAPLAIALKSGNFGAESFFFDAFAMLP